MNRKFKDRVLRTKKKITAVQVIKFRGVKTFEIKQLRLFLEIPAA